MPFSSRAQQAIQSFANNLGMPATPARDGSYGFVFERSGTLTLTASADGERSLMSLEARASRIDETVEAQLLALAGPDRITGRFLSAGLTREGNPMFVVSLGDEEMDLPTIEVCLQQLIAARETVT